jgi:sulfatase maturation enzyme AslB (radical SAM superfamily)
MCCQCIYGSQGRLDDESGKALNAREASLESLANNPLLKEVRAFMLKGKRHPQCQLCWMEEESKIKSQRQRVNQLFPKIKKKALKYTMSDGTVDTQHIKPSYFDVRFGIKCNLKCRMCGPLDSSHWIQDFVNINKDSWRTHGESPHVHYAGEDLKLIEQEGKWDYQSNTFKWYENSAFMNSLTSHLDQVERFYFTGGEPMLIKQHWDLLQLCIQQGYASKIDLQYNTNLTLIRPSHIQILKQFKTVSLGISIDGTGAVGEYIRHPSKWEQIKKNLELIDRCDRRFYSFITPTISIYNVLNILDLTQWIYKQKFKRIAPTPLTHVLELPSVQSIQVLPKNAKQSVEQKYMHFIRWMRWNMGLGSYKKMRTQLESILNYMYAEDKSYLLGDFLQTVDSLDKLRNEKLKVVIPEIYNLLGGCDVFSTRL